RGASIAGLRKRRATPPAGMHRRIRMAQLFPDGPPVCEPAESDSSRRACTLGWSDRTVARLGRTTPRTAIRRCRSWSRVGGALQSRTVRTRALSPAFPTALPQQRYRRLGFLTVTASSRSRFVEAFTTSVAAIERGDTVEALRIIGGVWAMRG